MRSESSPHYWGAGGAALAAIALTLATVSVAVADDVEPISPERPSFTNGTDIVAMGRIQLETGFTFSHASDGSHQSSLGDSTELRLPLTTELEVRLGPPAYIWAHGGDGSTASGFGDTMVSLKYRFLDAKSSKPTQPALAFIGGAELNTGDRAFRADDTQPSGAINADWTLSPTLGLTAAVVYTGIRQGGLRFDEWGTGLCLNISLTPKYATFAEVYHIDDNGAGSSHASYTDTGLTYRIGANTIVDINTGTALTGASNTYFFGAGIARRW